MHYVKILCVVFSLISDVGKLSYKLLKKHFTLDFHQCIDHEIVSTAAYEIIHLVRTQNFPKN